MNLNSFGIDNLDEYPHPFSPDHNDWNESYFFDWYTPDGDIAGHCRIGWHPVQKRVLFWLFIYADNEWLMIEEYRLPFDSLLLNENGNVFSYSGWGLDFSYKPEDPLFSGSLNISGFSRVIHGERQGQIVPVKITLSFKAVGPAHSRGGGEVESHSADGYSTNRYEQPIQADLQCQIADKLYDTSVRGERDHSWGPRPWDMQWTFLAINNSAFSLQATVVEIPGWPEQIAMGYYQPASGTMENLKAIEFALAFNEQTVTDALSGTIQLKTESGNEIAGLITAISGTEIDITHTFSEPKRTEYRRSLISADLSINDQTHTTVGWLESNRNIEG